MISTIFWALLFIVGKGKLCRTTGIVQDLNLTKYCPATNFCTQGASSNFTITEKQPCCTSCLCTNDCHMYGNCCPDVEYQVDRKFLMPECFFPVYNIDFETQDYYNDYIFTGINSYNVFIKCPDTYTNDTVKDMCEGIPNRLEDFALVSNEQGHVYKNKHCAHCHGIDNYLSWSLKMKCLSSENTEKFLNALPIVKSDLCMIWSFPKNAEIGRRSLCFRAYDTCEKPGSLRNACHSYTLNYFHNYRGLIFLFKNVHCFVCKLSETFIKGNCSLMTKDEASKFPSTLLPITALLDLDAQTDPTQADKLSKFKMCSEIYDSYFCKCRVLECPVISTALYGRCDSYYNNIIGFSVSILVELISIAKGAEFIEVKDSHDYSDQLKFSSFYETIGTTFIKSTKQFMKECGICETTVRENGTLMYIYIEFHTNDRCDLKSLHSNLYKYSQGNQRLNISLEGKIFPFKTRVRLSDLETILQMKFLFRIKNKICDNPILFKGGLTCPKITLNKTEYHTLIKMGKYPDNVLEREIPKFTNNIEKNDNKVTVSTGSIFKTVTQEFDVCFNEYQMLINTCSTMNKLKWQMIISAAFHALQMILLFPIQ